MSEHDDTIPRDTGKLWGAVHDIRGSVDALRAWAEGEVEKLLILIRGEHGDNGIRGNVKALHEDHAETRRRLEELHEDVQESKAWGRRLWEYERHQPGACIGKTEVDKLRSDLKAKQDREDARDAEHRRLMYSMMGAIIVAALTSAANIAVAVINAGGR